VTTGERGGATLLLRLPRPGRPPLTLARRQVRTDGRQPTAVALRPGRAARRRLKTRRHKLNGVLTVVARDMAGNTRRTTRPVQIGAGRRRRRRRRAGRR
jgi:hypothetical protein